MTEGPPMPRLTDDELAGRHPGTTGLLRYFEHEHLPEHLREVSAPVGELAHEMVAMLPDGPELTTGLRKLLEAKDCLVRAALDATITRSAPGSGPAGPATPPGRVAEAMTGPDGLPVASVRCTVLLGGELRCARFYGHLGPHELPTGEAFDR